MHRYRERVVVLYIYGEWLCKAHTHIKYKILTHKISKIVVSYLTEVSHVYLYKCHPSLLQSMGKWLPLVVVLQFQLKHKLVKA